MKKTILILVLSILGSALFAGNYTAEAGHRKIGVDGYSYVTYKSVETSTHKSLHAEGKKKYCSITFDGNDYPYSDGFVRIEENYTITGSKTYYWMVKTEVFYTTQWAENRAQAWIRITANNYSNTEYLSKYAQGGQYYAGSKTLPSGSYNLILGVRVVNDAGMYATYSRQGAYAMLQL